MKTTSAFLCKISYELGIHVIDMVIREHFELIDIVEIFVKSNKRELVFMRQIAHYFGMQCNHATLAKIGSYYGHKDHATVSHSKTYITSQISMVKGKICNEYVYNLIGELSEKIDNEIIRLYRVDQARLQASKKREIETTPSLEIQAKILIKQFQNDNHG